MATGFILLMQAGFALVENGTVRAKNSRNILIKNMFDLCIGAFIFWLVGFGIAYGHDEKGGVIGTNGNYYATWNYNAIDGNPYSSWIFQFAFSATSATIVSGSLAERTQLPAYMAFSLIMTGFIYPVVVSWTWGGGWLGDGGEDGETKGFHDFAGAGIVHMVGGVAGLAGALIVGPRHGKEKNPATRKNVKQDPSYKKLNTYGTSPMLEEWVDELQKETEFESNSYPFVVYGTIILFVSWLFFNGASTGTMFNPRSGGVSKIMMVTVLSGTTGGLVASFTKPHIMRTYSRHNRYDVGAVTNGLLAGLVAITAICDRVEPVFAIIIGALGGLVYGLSCKLLIALDIDDPIEASPVHGFCGLWGLIAVGIFDNQFGVLCGSEPSWTYLLW